MFNFKLHYCKARMVAYINGELPAPARQRIAQYIDECDQCYQEYRRQRALATELHASLPYFGTPAAGQLERIWVGVQAGLHSSGRGAQGGGTNSRLVTLRTVRYGMTTLTLVVMCLFALMLGNTSVSMAIEAPLVGQMTAGAMNTPRDLTPDSTYVAAATQQATEITTATNPHDITAFAPHTAPLNVTPVSTPGPEENR